MAIVALYNGVEVEVVNILTTSDNRKRAVIRALAGQPFTRFTMGGPENTDSAVIDPGLLSNVHQELPRQNGKIVPNYFLEEIERYKPLFTAHSRLQPWKGINSD